MELIVVTGMSGSGKSKAVDALEDIGFFCVDNVPPQLLSKFAELGEATDAKVDRIAVVVDARGGELFRDFIGSLDHLKSKGKSYKLLFIDADDSVLLKRFKEQRRRHPLLIGDVLNLEEAIKIERKMLENAKERSDYVIDTSLMTAAQLKERLVQTFLPDNLDAMPVYCISFGFKNGLPSESDLVFDLRCLPNPFYIPDLKELTGLDSRVHDYVLKWPQSKDLLKRLSDLVDFLLPLYQKEGKTQLVIAIGCTGGKHRSVVFAQELGQHLQNRHIRVVVNHRDKDK